MELYEPSQGLIWVFSKNSNILYIQSTYYVYVGSLQSVACNPLPIQNRIAEVELNVRGSYEPSSPPNLVNSAVWIKTNENVSLSDSNGTDEEIKADVEAHLLNNKTEFRVIATVIHSDGSEGGEAVNIIAQDAIIEIK